MRKYFLRLLFLIILVAPYFIPLNIQARVTEEDWVKIFDLNFSKIDKIPSTIHSITTSDTHQSAIDLSKRPEDDYLLIRKAKTDRGSVYIYGLTPQIRCRYTIDLEWSNDHSDSWLGAGVIIGVGGVRLDCYSSDGSKFFIRGQYYNESGRYLTAFVWDLGVSSRVSVTIDTDTSLGIAKISYTKAVSNNPLYRFFWGEDGDQNDENNIIELPFYYYRWTEDKILSTFTPDTIEISPLSANGAATEECTIIKLFKVTQEVYAPTSIVVVGSTEYQAFGYDGPHPYETVGAGMDEIRSSNMNATIFADINYITDPIYFTYLKGLISDGWELGIHYSRGLSTMRLENSTSLMMDQYRVISDAFKTHPLTWCSLGNLDNSTYVLLAYNNLNMIFRSLRVIPQNVPGSTDITNLTFEYWLGAVKSGVSTVPIYVHETELEPATSGSSVDASKFDAWLNHTFTNGIHLVGYYKWYMINNNQLDANIFSNIEGDNTTIISKTNGYNAVILVKIKADSVIAIWHNEKVIDYSTSPDGYLVFEVEDGGKYLVTTITYPVNLITEYNVLSYFIISVVIILASIFFLKIYKQRKNKFDETEKMTL